MNKSVY